MFYDAKRLFFYKPAAAVVTCRRGGAGNTFDQLNKYFTISSMPVVSSQYWNGVHGDGRRRSGQIWRGCRPCAWWGTIWPGCSAP